MGIQDPSRRAYPRRDERSLNESSYFRSRIIQPVTMTELSGQLRLHDKFCISAQRLGSEGVPVLVVDNFLSKPEILIDFAAEHCAFEGVTDTFYPGTRAVAPGIYCFAIRAFLGQAIGETFGLSASEVMGELSHFSLVTTPPDKLSVVQRMPHYDNTNPKQLAVLHYLCGAEFGGTSFYRHRGTGYEYVDEARNAPYQRALNGELANQGPPPRRYICQDDNLFERTGSCAAAFNRVIVYRSINLHSADIRPGFNFRGGPRTGRLTVNTFFYYR